ncbi:hypothetical protein SETIT_7G002300v2 [Setaria italica]|uniref:Uncharacterized protein n=2 Tax=Setaria TaxID=4554 RepID=A0A368RQI9_SETIT|nr:hypothetical protein SETIT_7G002300v2 [Setaria italica]TKW02824.1 hypothetical protein SEVIR_7G036600v2 [Setaria viridis]
MSDSSVRHYLRRSRRKLPECQGTAASPLPAGAPGRRPPRLHQQAGPAACSSTAPASSPRALLPPGRGLRGARPRLLRGVLRPRLFLDDLLAGLEAVSVVGIKICSPFRPAAAALLPPVLHGYFGMDTDT